MSTLDDKILGERAGDNYCSSSDDDEAGPGAAQASAAPAPRPSSARYNTGPKGVLEDWRRYKQLQSEQRNQQSKEVRQLAEKLSMSCRTAADDERASAIEKQSDAVKEQILEEDDPFVKQYMQKRLAEIQAQLVEKQRGQSGQKFGVMYALKSADAYLDAADKDSAKCTVIIHIYDSAVVGCNAMNETLAQLAMDYPAYKFCSVLASLLGTTSFFKRAGVPTLQAYRDGQLIGNFVRGDLQQQLSDDFAPDEVASLLIEYGILPDAHENRRLLQSAA